MCFSEHLARESNGYEVAGAWIQVGFKYILRHKPTGFLVPQFAGYQHLVYPVREPFFDDHGIHLAATPQGAEQHGRRDVDPVSDWEAVLIRVLCPEVAIVDDSAHVAHAHICMVIPPGERETDADLLAVRQAVSGLIPMPDPVDPRTPGGNVVVTRRPVGVGVA